MKKLVDLKLSAFLDDLSSRNHTPGGGSIAALSGALGAALSSMVCNFSQVKKESQEDKEIKELLQQCEALREYLTNLIDEDSMAYDQVLKAYKLPQKTREQKKQRKEEIQKSLQKAACVPLNVARTCKKILDVTLKLTEKGNKKLISDVAVAAHLAFAGIEAGRYNVKINLCSIKDEEFIQQTKEEIEVLHFEATKTLKTVTSAVDKAMEA